jgi:hypothetical protein
MTTYKDIKNKYIEFDQHESDTGSTLDFLSPRLLTAEFGFLIVTFLISVSLINAIRPMPIGWDDLGVYMNFPRMMAVTGSILEWAGMFTWQLITGSGFLWNQIAAEAFYVNQLWGILSMIVLTSVLSVILEKKDHKYLICLPIILSGIYYMMPMTIFQQAKDMKLDPALMAVSVSAFGLLWYSLREKIWKKEFYYVIALVGLIIGIAFSIKLTSLMLIIASLALIAYRILGITGFIGFFFIFIWVFTGGNLWAKMNVWMPVENIELIRNITIGCLSIGFIWIVLAIWQYGKTNTKTWFITSLIFIVWLLWGLSPWFIKNGIETKVFTQEQKGSTIDSLLGGYREYTFSNYSKIYSIEEYTQKRKEQQSASITSDGKSQNEDFSRYFGQESGLNNYLKLPANLTFQKNQSGEFTEITFIFFAFLPAILLFVRGKKYKNIKGGEYIFPILVAVFMGLLISYYFIEGTGTFISGIMWEINLPLWYACIIGGIITMIIASHFLIADEDQWKDIKDTIVVLLVYGFLFLISAFGIVWYGVFVYFLFLTLIGLASLAFVTYRDDEDEDLIWVKSTISILFFLFIVVYILRSAFPHGWNNLINAGMNEYKYNKLDQNESIFTYRADYITPIATMNVVDPKAVVKRAGNLASSITVKKILTPERLEAMSAADLHQVLLYFVVQLESGKPIQDRKNIETDIKNIWNELYWSILLPKWDDINNKWIYRIGTFMTYLINKNQQRYIDDSLVFDFETFFYEPSPEKTIEKMKKQWIGYLLTDLNAATIDKDPRRVLTKRFEHLLLSMRAKNLKLVESDNLCLKIAIDEYKSGKLQSDIEFIDIAGTNYESYRWDNLQTVVNRNIKQNKCANYAISMINNSAKSGSTLPVYLVPIRDELLASKDTKTQQSILGRAFGQSYFALFEIIDEPIPTNTQNTISNPVITNTWITQ